MLNGIPGLANRNRMFEGGERPLSKDSFQYTAVMGTGSFSKVYKAQSKDTRAVYAVKTIQKSQIEALKLKDQLNNEISILARCNHPNIIRFFGTFEDDTTISIVQEFANNGSVFSQLKQVKRFNTVQAANIIADVTKAIMYLHSLNPPVLHRDLKPENILVSNSNYKIADFGWSNVDDKDRNTFCGTLDYLAPEMIKGEKHNEKLDIWCIGVLLYELLNGVPPFTPKERGMDARLVRKAIENNILKMQIDFNQYFTPDAIKFIKLTLNPNPALRPTAAELFETDFFKLHGKIPDVPQNIRAHKSQTHIQLSQPLGVPPTVNSGYVNSPSPIYSSHNLSPHSKQQPQMLPGQPVQSGQLEVMQEQYERLLAKFNQLNASVNEKDNTIRSQKLEIDSYREQIKGYQMSLANVKNAQPNNEQLQAENAKYKALVDNTKSFFENKLQRVLTISTKIGEFHSQHITQTNRSRTPNLPLDLDSVEPLLDDILAAFVELKRAPTQSPYLNSRSFQPETVPIQVVKTVRGLSPQPGYTITQSTPRISGTLPNGLVHYSTNIHQNGVH